MKDPRITASPDVDIILRAALDGLPRIWWCEEHGAEWNQLEQSRWRCYEFRWHRSLCVFVQQCLVPVPPEEVT